MIPSLVRLIENLTSASVVELPDDVSALCALIVDIQVAVDPHNSEVLIPRKDLLHGSFPLRLGGLFRRARLSRFCIGGAGCTLRCRVGGTGRIRRRFSAAVLVEKESRAADQEHSAERRGSSLPRPAPPVPRPP